MDATGGESRLGFAVFVYVTHCLISAGKVSSSLVTICLFFIIMGKRMSHKDGESPLKILREELGMSQESFGQAIGAARRTIVRWENGESIPAFTITQVKNLVKLLKSHGKNIEDLPDSLGPSDISLKSKRKTKNDK